MTSLDLCSGVNHCRKYRKQSPPPQSMTDSTHDLCKTISSPAQISDQNLDMSSLKRVCLVALPQPVKTKLQIRRPGARKLQRTNGAFKTSGIKSD